MSDTTQHMYARHVRKLIEFFDREPTEITERQLEDYFLHRRNEDEWSPSTLKICYCGIKFFYINVLKKDWHLFKILKAQPEKRLPCVLSREEVFKILSKVKPFHNHTYLFTVYSLGLRLYEALCLQVSDIDAKRMQVHIHRGKGAKDRFVPLPADTLALLRKYWKTHRNPTLIFPALGRGEKNGPTATTPMAIDSVQGSLRGARSEAGITKRRVTIHTLRHSSATHLLDAGVNIRYIQQFLGHSSPDTTIIYLHLTKKGKEDAYDIIDKLMKEEKMTTIRDIFQEHGPGYIEKYGDKMPENHKQVINAISNCRTGQCGVAVYLCKDCSEVHRAPLSCGNRHCPTCQHLKTFQWNERVMKNKLPTHSFLATFTVPEGIRNFIRSNQKDAYDALFKSSSDAIRQLALNPKHIGGDVPGFFGVLHTWGRQIQYHPHIHYVITGGAISTDDGRWHPSAVDFFLPVKALSIVFKAKFRDLMKEKGLYDRIPADVWKIDWNVNIQATHGVDAIGYLSQYVFKVAISDYRIVEVMDGKVTFTWSKPRSKRKRRLTLDSHEFIRRYLQHVLPRRFVKVRYHGFMHPCSSHSKTVKSLIELSLGFEVEQVETETETKQIDPKACPLCGGKLEFLFVIYSDSMEKGVDTS